MGASRRFSVDERARGGEQCGEAQRLHHDLGVRVPGVPNLNHVEGEQQRASERHTAAEESRSRDIHRHQAQDGPETGRPPRARQTINPVADGDGRRVQVRELTDDRPLRRIEDVEPHEAQPVVGLALVLRVEHVAKPGRHGADHGIADDERSALRDLDAFVQVDARIFPAHHILGGRKEHPDAQRDERHRRHGAAIDRACPASVQQATAEHSESGDRDHRVCQ